MSYKYKKHILHIDMNSFFASCEQAVNPELKKTPLIVGGDPKRRSGIVLAACYGAKKYGVKTTMPLYKAAQLCPEATIIKASHSLYGEMSRKVMAIFDDYTPLKQQVSIDEAFLDMTGTENLFGDIYTVAKTIQKRILNELALPCSVGISSNKLLAKMGSDYKKPMGITTIFPHEVEQKLWPLPVGELYGVGKQSVIKLGSMGINTIGDLAGASLEILISYFGNKAAKLMHDHANGRDDDLINPGNGSGVKSVGNELTYTTDITDIDIIKREILLLSDKVGYRLRKKMLKGRTISIKIKYNDFSIITRSKTINKLTDSTDKIYDIAKELILKNINSKAIRLLGVTISNFDSGEDIQLSLFDTNEEHNQVDAMVDAIREKYGYGSMRRGTNMIKF